MAQLVDPFLDDGVVDHRHLSFDLVGRAAAELDVLLDRKEVHAGLYLCLPGRRDGGDYQSRYHEDAK
jgi:hypothetical protein